MNNITPEALAVKLRERGLQAFVTREGVDMGAPMVDVFPGNGHGNVRIGFAAGEPHVNFIYTRADRALARIVFQVLDELEVGT